jgi:multicomponent Na+:H+ antiporter subunit E
MRKLFLWVAYLLYFFKELVKSNLRVASDVLRIRPRIRPGLVKVPMNLPSDWAIVVYANSITLTPGTVSVEVSDDRKFIYVHSMYIDGTKEDFIKACREGFEVRVRRLFQ